MVAKKIWLRKKMPIIKHLAVLYIQKKKLDVLVTVPTV